MGDKHPAGTSGKAYGDVGIVIREFGNPLGVMLSTERNQVLVKQVGSLILAAALERDGRLNLTT
jgi:predicted regulator of Ras-like GTPase activity (Roadblock/LC7/MglB family)